MAKLETMHCTECDHEIPTTREWDDYGQEFLDCDDNCPHCGATTLVECDGDTREDFHSDV